MLRAKEIAVNGSRKQWIEFFFARQNQSEIDILCAARITPVERRLMVQLGDETPPFAVWISRPVREPMAIRHQPGCHTFGKRLCPFAS